jgi:hypothetical protein
VPREEPEVLQRQRAKLLHLGAQHAEGRAVHERCGQRLQQIAVADPVDMEVVQEAPVVETV